MSVRQLAAVGAVAALLLAGCSDDGPTPQLPDDSSASAPTETPTAAEEPSPPPETEGNGEVAAEAFVKYYFAMYDYAVNSAETRHLQELALPSCAACEGITDAIRATAQNGGHIRGGTHDVRSVRVSELGGATGTKTYRGNATVFTTEQVIEGSGVDGLDGTYPEGISRFSVLLTRDKDGWRFAEWRLL